MKNKFGLVIFYVVLFVGFIFLLGRVLQNSGATEELELFSEVVDLFENNQVEAFNIKNDTELTIKATDGKKYYYELRSLDLFYAELSETIKANYASGVLKEWNYEPLADLSWLSFLPLILVVVGIVVWMIFINASMNGKNGAGGRMNNFGKARVKTPQNSKDKVLFRDVAGADEEKAELQEVVQFLRDPAKFTRLGAKIPHGVLLVGPPGTGKTLLAKAVAGEADVPFLSISGSDFMEMYVGVGASRVRDLFETARKSPAAIIFIDEIDAVGRHRGAGLGGGHDEREQTLNQLLVEMDGFGSHDGVIVIAATNRPDILDPALTRPGRFDRQITVGYPDLHGRTDILKVHTRNKPLEADVSLEDIARMTVGFTGADLANLMNEAALLAARRNKSLIGMYDIKDAMIRILAGPQKKTKTHKPDELKKTAYHEAGHAIVRHCLPGLDPVVQISIVPSGNALGYTMHAPTEDRYSVYKQEMKSDIATLLAGRVAEELIFDDISGGASNDIQRATKTAQRMVTKLGMSETLGPICYGSDQGEIFLGRDFSSSQDYSDATALKIDEEVHRIVSEAYAVAKEILQKNIDKLHFISEFLLKNEVMDGEQFARAMEGDVTFEELEDMTEAKRRRSREENDRRLAEEAQREQAEKERREREAAQQKHTETKKDDDDGEIPPPESNRFSGKH